MESSEKRFSVISAFDYDMCNVFNTIGNEWMLITAENEGRVNTMTASWGMLGYLWGKPVISCFIRPQRFTFSMLESAKRMSVSFLPSKHRKDMQICGCVSGRDCDKLSMTSLSVSHYGSVPYISEACSTLICKKLYASPLDLSCFTSSEPLSNYNGNDTHKQFIYEIEKILIRK